MRLSYSKICIYLSLVIIALNITACGSNNATNTTDISDFPETSICEQGINNTVCSSYLLEDSVWGFGPFTTSVEINGVSQEFEISHFYKFYNVDQTYEHYLFIKVPTINSYLMERIFGNITLSNDSQEIEFARIESSCNGEDSIFSIFDQSDEKLEINRNEGMLMLEMPTDYLEDYLDSIRPKLDSLEAILWLPINVFYYAIVAIFAAVLQVFTPEFIESFVTGALEYDENTMILFQERYDKSIEGCFSQEGITRAIQYLRNN
ncbi:hypothetical protein ACFL6N_04680 [Thermodesulfobacteriota bacterium]